MRAIALGARRELAGFNRSLDNLYMDIQSRVDDETLMKEIRWALSDQESFISDYPKACTDRTQTNSFRQVYVRGLRRYEASLKDAYKDNDHVRKTVAILVGGLAVGVSPPNGRDTASHGLRMALAA